MKLVSWNVNGIRSIYKKGALTELMFTERPDILCLQETKAEQGQSPVDYPNYEEYWNSSAARKGYSGVAIFSKVQPLSVQYGFSEELVQEFHLASDPYGDPNKEGRVITLEFPDYFVVNCYTPNSKEDLSRLTLRHKHWDPAFLAHLKTLEEKKPVIFCGDLNVAHKPIDLTDPKSNESSHGYTKEERAGFDSLIAAGFVDTYREKHGDKTGAYTWWSPWRGARERNIGWRIDYICISKVLATRLLGAHIHPSVLGSDHCPVSIELK